MELKQINTACKLTNVQQQIKQMRMRGRWTQPKVTLYHHKITTTPTSVMGIFSLQMSQAENGQTGKTEIDKPVIEASLLVQNKVKTEQTETNQFVQLDSLNDTTGTSFLDYSTTELQELGVRMKQQPGERLTNWLTQLWDHDISWVTVNENTIGHLGALSSDLLIV